MVFSVPFSHWEYVELLWAWADPLYAQYFRINSSKLEIGEFHMSSLARDTEYTATVDYTLKRENISAKLLEFFLEGRAKSTGFI